MSERRDMIRDLRREPPAFRTVTVRRIEDISPCLRRFTLTGAELQGLAIDEVAASIRLLLPSYGDADLTLPEWAGNEFLLPDGRRPLIRTLTPRYLRPDALELDLDVVLHGDVGMSGWAIAAGVGDRAAVSGPGRGYQIDPEADPMYLLGDETAIPAISQLLERVPSGARIEAHVEARPEARHELPGHARAGITWHDSADGAEPGAGLLPAVGSLEIGEDARVWAAGEAAKMQRIRRHMAAAGVARHRTTVRGYWKHGRAGPGV